MQSKVFDKLEKRVGEAIRRIDFLSQERIKLDGKVKDLTERNKELRREIKALSKDSISRSEFEDRKKLLEQRVQALLQRFDELDEGGDAAAAEAS